MNFAGAQFNNLAPVRATFTSVGDPQPFCDATLARYADASAVLASPRLALNRRHASDASQGYSIVFKHKSDCSTLVLLS